jgi:ABC-type uncharacterized transport system substrate-binding protein
MKIRPTALLMSAFLVVLIGSILWVNATRPRVLVLHSYFTDYVWTREINVGLERVMNDQSWIQMRYHYMDTKKKSDDEHLRRASIAAIKAIEDTQPDVVIAIDDYAQKLAAMKFVNDPKIKIVFAGVNGSVKPYHYDTANNVTGILERKPVSAVRETIAMLSREVGGGQDAFVMLLTDTTLSAHKDADYLKSFNWAPMSFIGTAHVKDYDEWKARVKNIKDETDFLLVGGYRKIKRHANSPAKDGFVPPAELMTWTEANSPVPVIGINVFNTEEGAMLSIGVSPYEQGSEAAKMARRIIEKGVSPKDIPIKTSQQYVVSFRRSALEKRKLTMPKIFEAFARATDNYYE